MRASWLLAGLVGAGLTGLIWLADRNGWLAALNGDSEAVRLCEYVLTAALKSPASYRRVELHEFDHGGSTLIMLTYDAANSFGAPLRGHLRCRVAPDDSGRPELTELDLDDQTLSAEDLRTWTILYRTGPGRG